ncbi:unnamed protein product, partial [Mesorhabditis spiculigera]
MTTVRSQFFISPDSIISLSYDDVDGRIGCEVNEEGSAFLLPEGWSSLLFFVESQELSRPQTPIHPPNERPPSPYYPAVPPEAAPAPKAFLQWMYYQQDAADGQKDTVSEVVEKGPSIARAEEAEPFTLAGYGNVYNIWKQFRGIYVGKPDAEHGDFKRPQTITE